MSESMSENTKTLRHDLASDLTEQKNSRTMQHHSTLHHCFAAGASLMRRHLNMAQGVIGQPLGLKQVSGKKPEDLFHILRSYHTTRHTNSFLIVTLARTANRKWGGGGREAGLLHNTTTQVDE